MTFTKIQKVISKTNFLHVQLGLKSSQPGILGRLNYSLIKKKTKKNSHTVTQYKASSNKLMNQ